MKQPFGFGDSPKGKRNVSGVFPLERRLIKAEKRVSAVFQRLVSLEKTIRQQQNTLIEK